MLDMHIRVILLALISSNLKPAPKSFPALRIPSIVPDADHGVLKVRLPALGVAVTPVPNITIAWSSALQALAIIAIDVHP